MDLITGQNHNVKITGKQIGKGRLYGIAEAGYDDAALKIRCGMQYQLAVIDLHRGAVRKPGADRCGRELL